MGSKGKLEATLPLKRSKSYSRNVTVRVEPELKVQIDKLNKRGYDVPELMRNAIRERIQTAVEYVEEHLDESA